MTPEENRRMRDAYGTYAPGFESTRPMQASARPPRPKRGSAWGARILALVLAIGAVGAFFMLARATVDAITR